MKLYGVTIFLTSRYRNTNGSFENDEIVAEYVVQTDSVESAEESCLKDFLSKGYACTYAEAYELDDPMTPQCISIRN